MKNGNLCCWGKVIFLIFFLLIFSQLKLKENYDEAKKEENEFVDLFKKKKLLLHHFLIYPRYIFLKLFFSKKGHFFSEKP